MSRESLEGHLSNELNKMETRNLSDTPFKTLVIRMLKELIKYGNNIKEEMKAILREIKKNPQEANSEGKEARIQINDLEHKEEINNQPEQNQETRTQKNEESLRRLSKRANICITGEPGGEEEEQEIENLFEKIMEENFPNLAKEIDIQVQEAQKVPNKDPKRTKPRHIRIKMSNVIDRDRTLRAAREKQTVTFKEFS